jgi:hypothetical protein
MALKRLCPALLFHDVALVLSNVFQDPLLEDRGHVEVAEQEEPSPIGLAQDGGQCLDTVLLQLLHFVLVRRSQELLRKRNTLNSVLRIRDVYPGSRIRLFSIPDPHQRI